MWTEKQDGGLTMLAYGPLVTQAKIATVVMISGASVTTTCYAVGFNNLSHFIRSFRRRFGSPPSHSGKKAQARLRVPMA